MSSLFSSKIPEPEPPATMPDENSAEAKRAKRSAIVPAGGKESTRLASTGGTIGREYTRGTLG